MTNPPRISPVLGRPTRPMGRKLPKPPRAMPMGLPTGKRPVPESPKKSVKPTEVNQGKVIDLNIPIPGVSYFAWKYLSLEQKFEMYKQHEYKQFDKEMAAKDVIEQIHRVRVAPDKEKQKAFSPYKKCEEVCCTIITSPFSTTHWPYCSYDCKDWAEKVARSMQQ